MRASPLRLSVLSAARSTGASAGAGAAAPALRGRSRRTRRRLLGREPGVEIELVRAQVETDARRREARHIDLHVELRLGRGRREARDDGFLLRVDVDGAVERQLERLLRQGRILERHRSGELRQAEDLRLGIGLGGTRECRDRLARALLQRRIERDLGDADLLGLPADAVERQLAVELARRAGELELRLHALAARLVSRDVELRRRDVGVEVFARPPSARLRPEVRHAQGTGRRIEREASGLGGHVERLLVERPLECEIEAGHRIGAAFEIHIEVALGVDLRRQCRLGGGELGGNADGAAGLGGKPSGLHVELLQAQSVAGHEIVVGQVGIAELDTADLELRQRRGLAGLGRRLRLGIGLDQVVDVGAAVLATLDRRRQSVDVHAIDLDALRQQRDERDADARRLQRRRGAVRAEVRQGGAWQLDAETGEDAELQRSLDAKRAPGPLLDGLFDLRLVLIDVHQRHDGHQRQYHDADQHADADQQFLQHRRSPHEMGQLSLGKNPGSEFRKWPKRAMTRTRQDRRMRRR